jgi:hypothetical protein
MKLTENVKNAQPIFTESLTVSIQKDWDNREFAEVRDMFVAICN